MVMVIIMMGMMMMHGDDDDGEDNRGGSSNFPRGGYDPTTMRSIVHEPRSGEPIFFDGYFEPP